MTGGKNGTRSLPDNDNDLSSYYDDVSEDHNDTSDDNDGAADDHNSAADYYFAQNYYVSTVDLYDNTAAYNYGDDPTRPGTTTAGYDHDADPGSSDGPGAASYWDITRSTSLGQHCPYGRCGPGDE